MQNRVVVAVLALGVGGSVFGFGATAGAQDPVYPPSNRCGLQLSASAVRPDQTFTVTGTQGSPNVPVTITFESTPVVIATTTTDAAGSFEVDATVPAGAEPGLHTVRAVGQTSCTAQVRLEAAPSVQPPYRGRGSGLAFTGANPLALVLMALIALTLGYVILAGDRRQSARRETIRRDREERSERTFVG